jgi:hypothetical protein
MGLLDQFATRFEKYENDVGELGKFTRHETAVLGPQVTEGETTQCTRAGEVPVPRPPMSESFEIMKEFVEYDREVLALLDECGAVPGEEPMEKIGVEATALIDIGTLAEKLPLVE